VLIRKMN
jgi:hypothetical protein